jgi:hypothetical protein
MTAAEPGRNPLPNSRVRLLGLLRRLPSPLRVFADRRAANRLRFAAAPFFPSALRVFFGRCAIVRFRLAAAAAFLMFLRAAAFCFCDAIVI